VIVAKVFNNRRRAATTRLEEAVGPQHARFGHGNYNPDTAANVNSVVIPHPISGVARALLGNYNIPGQRRQRTLQDIPERSTPPMRTGSTSYEPGRHGKSGSLGLKDL
jgi:hypothetical protein